LTAAAHAEHLYLRCETSLQKFETTGGQVLTFPPKVPIVTVWGIDL
jgi:hypothetical protein